MAGEPRDMSSIYHYGLQVDEATAAAGIPERSVHAHSIAVHFLEAGRGIEYVADHLGHKNIQNTKVYAQISNPFREQVCRDLEPHPKIVRLQ
jgi:site-specific recombinase XerD